MVGINNGLYKLKKDKPKKPKLRKLKKKLNMSCLSCCFLKDKYIDFLTKVNTKQNYKKFEIYIGKLQV